MTAHSDGDQVDPGRIRRWRQLLASERDAAALYSRLAAAESGERSEILRELAGVERTHAAHWEGKLRQAGAPVPPPSGPSLRTRLLSTAARRLSAAAVLPMIERAERSDAGVYDVDPDAAPGMAEDERGQARTLAKLIGGLPDPGSRSQGAKAGTAATDRARCGPGWRGCLRARSRWRLASTCP